MTHATSPVRTRPALVRRALIALACAGAAVASHATPVSVSISGLPPGLQPTLKIQRNVCPDGMGWITNPSQALTEQTSTTYDRITLPGGGIQLRPRVVTRYVATFDTPATPTASSNPLEVRCSRVGINADLLSFTLQVPGQDERGRSVQWQAGLGQTPMDAPVTLNTTLSARTASITLAGATQDLLPRGAIHTLRLELVASGGAVGEASVSLLRPLPTSPFLRATAARLFQTADGRACIAAQGSTRCIGDAPGPLMHGGVQLFGIAVVNGRTQLQFTLLQEFPTGPVTVRASADAADLPLYRVDGDFVPLDLLPWQALERTFTVQ
jgi:hypothetical protein